MQLRQLDTPPLAADPLPIKEASRMNVHGVVMRMLSGSAFWSSTGWS
jgi:hypothetical protein